MKQLLNLILLLSTLSVLAQTGQKNFIDQNYIEVTGKAEMQVTPDLIYIKILLSEKDNRNRVPITETERNMVNKFQELGIDVKKDLSMNDLLSHFRAKLLAKSDIILSKEYQLVVHDAKTASKVFTELEKLDISNVSIEKLDHTKIEEFRKEVKVNAIKAAKDKADYLSKSVGQTIGKAIYIEELNNSQSGARQSNVLLRGYAYSSYENAKQEIDLDFEKIKLEYSILTRFELK